MKDNKNITITTSLLLVLIIGSLLFFKTGDSVVLKDDYIPEEETQEEISDEPFNIHRTNIDRREFFKTNTQTKAYPVLDFDSEYEILLGEYFELPSINEESSIPSVVELTIYFKEINSDIYKEVELFDTNKLGEYKVHYRVTNHFNLTTEKDIFIRTIDVEKPKTEAYLITKNNDTYTYEPVAHDTLVNKDVTLNFYDNDKIDRVEYYRELLVYSDNTIEEENLMDVFETKEDKLVLDTDGVFYIRSYDRSNNYNEFKVEIDKTKAKLDSKYELTCEGVLVTIYSNEYIKDIEGYERINDYALRKLYKENKNETLYVYDKANNISNININVNQYMNILLTQNNIETNSTQLNLNDGEIKLNINSNIKYELNVIKDDNEFNLVDNIINEEGHYEINIKTILEEKRISLDISYMTQDN